MKGIDDNNEENKSNDEEVSDKHTDINIKEIDKTSEGSGMSRLNANDSSSDDNERTIVGVCAGELDNNPLQTLHIAKRGISGKNLNPIREKQRRRNGEEIVHSKKISKIPIHITRTTLHW